MSNKPANSNGPGLGPGPGLLPPPTLGVPIGAAPLLAPPNLGLKAPPKLNLPPPTLTPLAKGVKPGAVKSKIPEKGGNNLMDELKKKLNKRLEARPSLKNKNGL